MRNTIFEILADSTEKYAEHTAIRYLKKREVIDRTYGQLMEDVQKITLLLEERKLVGKHIAILGPSSYEWITAYLAIVTSGSVALPLDAGLGDADLLELLERGHVDGFFHDKAKNALSDAWKEKNTSGVDVELNTLQEMLAGMELTEEKKTELSLQSRAVDCDQTCTIMFTSGTTGKSKGVMLSNRNLANNVDSVPVQVNPGTVVLSVLPIHHAYCLSMDYLKGIASGATLCINDSLLHMMKNIKRFEPNVILMVPLMIETIVKKLKEVNPLIPKKMVRKEVFGPNLDMICAGGAYLDPYYIEELKKYGVEIYQGYGMTECSPVIATNWQQENRAGSVGKAMPNCEVRIADEEIQVRGTSVMSGYYEMPGETEETLQDGWLCTGDLGRIDEEGYIFITGRKKNLIILSNGENISPEEIEGKLSLHDLIGEIVVTGNGNYLTAHVFPEESYVDKKHWSEEKVEKKLQDILDEYNKTQPTYRRIIGLDIRKEPFEKSSTKKIKRNLVV